MAGLPHNILFAARLTVNAPHCPLSQTGACWGTATASWVSSSRTLRAWRAAWTGRRSASAALCVTSVSASGRCACVKTTMVTAGARCVVDGQRVHRGPAMCRAMRFGLTSCSPRFPPPFSSGALGGRQHSRRVHNGPRVRGHVHRLAACHGPVKHRDLQGSVPLHTGRRHQNMGRGMHVRTPPWVQFRFRAATNKRAYEKARRGHSKA